MTSIYKSSAGQKEIMDLYDAMLLRWPVPYDTYNVATRYGDTFIVASGSISSPPMVLLHGSSSNALTWMHDIAEYSQHFRVYAVDILGEPGKSAPARLELDSLAIAEWLEDCLDQLQIKQTVLLGISLGGWMALKYAVCHPQRVSRLVLLAPAGVVQARRGFILRAIACYILRYCNRDIANRLNYGDQLIQPETLHFMNVISDHFKPRFSAIPIFTDGEIQKLNMPILLVAGAKDNVFPTDRTAERLKRLLPQSTVKILPEAGHVLSHLSPLVLPFLVDGPST